MKRYGFLVCIALLSFCSFVAIKYVAKKINWRNELRFKLLFNSQASWMKEQLREDLSSLRPEDLSSDKLEAVLKEQYGKGDPFLLVRYRICNNCLKTNYFEGGRHPRAPVVEQAFEEILSVIKLPDVDFLISLGEAADHGNFGVPVFAFAKDSSLNEPVILMPDFEALEGYRLTLREVSKGKDKYPWGEKVDKAFWRGATTGMGFFSMSGFLHSPRSRLVALSKEHSGWVDAKFSYLCQSSEPEKILDAFPDFFGKEAKISDHIAYKYQLLVDGNSCAYSRAYWQLFSGCLTFKQQSSNTQWYYKGLKPYVHYVPVQSDFSDLIAQMEWAKSHDAEAQKIAKNAQQFAEKNLRKSDIRYYMAQLLIEYAKIQSHNTKTL